MLDGPVTVEPWFLRRGDVHVEHGHLYDPDNAPAHPLSRPGYRSEPLGVALSRRFLGPYDAYDLGNRYDATAQDNARLLFQLFGWRAPFAILHYCALLVGLNVETLSDARLNRERREGAAALAAYCGRCGIDDTTLRALLTERPSPTHTSAARTFGRFDFDGTLATLAVPAGLGTAIALAPIAGTSMAALGLAYLLLSRQRRARRAANQMPEQLRSGAALVRRLTGARLVVFGHTHREEESEGYVNLGAFGDPPRPKRTYVRVDLEGRAERRTLA